MHLPRFRFACILLTLVVACARSDGSSEEPAADDPLANDTVPASFIATADATGDTEAVIELATDSLRAPVHPQQLFLVFPRGDTLAKYMVFAARGQSWYTAAARGKRCSSYWSIRWQAHDTGPPCAFRNPLT